MNLTDNARVVLEKRYLRKDPNTRELLETPEEMFWRVAEHAASAEETQVLRDFWSHKFYKALLRKEFIPNSPTLMNAGLGRGTLSACFVLPVEDSMEGIMEAATAGALVQKFGGGTGYSVSRIRAKGSIINSTHGVACGALSVLRHLNEVSKLVTQGGTREGANMGVLRVDHPEIMDFIDLKRGVAQPDGTHAVTELLNFNVSVGITDSFMEALNDNDTYELVDPHSGPTGKLLEARAVWDAITANAWRTGDPGLIFLDKINRWRSNPVPDVYGDIETTNPCVTGDMWVDTSDGPRQVRDLVGTGSVGLLVNGQVHQSDSQGFFATGRQRILKIKTRQGFTIKVTADHKMYRPDGTTVDAGQLHRGEVLALSQHTERYWEGSGNWQEGLLLGYLVGDGTIKGPYGAALRVWDSEHRVDLERALQYAADELWEGVEFNQLPDYGLAELSSSKLRNLAISFDINKAKQISPKIEGASSNFLQGFLRGFFDADGTVLVKKGKGSSIRLAQSDLPRLEATQRMLLRFGIYSKIYKNRRPEQAREWQYKGETRTYISKAQHELVISRQSMFRFQNIIGFSSHVNHNKVQQIWDSYERGPYIDKFEAVVDSIEQFDEEEVFDVSVPGLNQFTCQGFIVHNCGEKPMHPWDSCVLGHVNLMAMLDKYVEFDFDKYEETVILGIRFLDNLITVNDYPAIPGYEVSPIKKMSESLRRIGLGVIGFADLLYTMKISYGSKDGFNTADVLAARLREFADSASIDLAIEKGSFPLLSQSNINHPRMRNAVRTTIAPTGTTALIVGASPGIEPNYGLSFFRQHRLERNAETGRNEPVVMSEVNEIFNQQLGKLELDKEVKKAIRDGLTSGLTLEQADLGKHLPLWMHSVFITAREVDAEAHVRMQSAWQTHIDDGVSKTVNLPHTATQSDVGIAYRLAYELSCLGITVYRDGSRAMQVYTNTVGEANIEVEKEKEPSMNGRRKLSNDVSARRHKFRVGEQEGFIHVGEYDDGMPGEIFITLTKQGSTLAGFASATAILLSRLLQHGDSIESLARHFEGMRFEPSGMTSNSDLPIATSIVDYVLRWLRMTYMPPTDGTAQHGHEGAAQPTLGGGVCPDCQTPTYFTEGCERCSRCEWSRCG